MGGHGSHAILVLPIPFEVPNGPNATFNIHVTNKMPTTTNGYRRPGSISLRIGINKCLLEFLINFLCLFRQGGFMGLSQLS